jgi:hypothetical protein
LIRIVVGDRFRQGRRNFVEGIRSIVTRQFRRLVGICNGGKVGRPIEVLFANLFNNSQSNGLPHEDQ